VASAWLFAHNLGFDLTVSRLPDLLHRLGWQMGSFSFAGRNVMGHMRKGNRTLWLVDSTSWWPDPLDTLGRAVGRDKLPRPAEDAPEEAWVEYCENDARILSEVVATMLGWWDANRLGHFAKTGPGCGWNALRHTTPNFRVLVKTEEGGREADRRAVYGGRRDVTRTGTIPGGPFALVDFQNAHLSVAAHCLLPKGRLKHRQLDVQEIADLPRLHYGAVAECEVECDTPRYPLRTPDGIFYPVGRFRTVLAQPELQLAADRGDLRDVGKGYIHDLGYPLSGWARWALAQLDPGTSTAPVVARLAVKQWGRSVIGKFGARTSRMVDRGPALHPGWHLERGTCGPDHAAAADLHIAGRHWWVAQDLESDNAYPAVLAWVESYVRVALGRMLDALGEDLWICCDTDGAVIDLTHARTWLAEGRHRFGRTRNPMAVAQAVCDAVAPLTWPLVPRPKVVSGTLTVAGPQHYAGDTFERAAGRPRRDGERAGDEDIWWRWPKVGWQMQHGSEAGFVRTMASWTAPATTAHRWVLADGTAVPVIAGISDDGSTFLTPWGDGYSVGVGALLAGAQSSAVARVSRAERVSG